MIKLAFKHKIISSLCIVVLIGIIFFSYRAIAGRTGETRYILAQAENGTISTSVSGTGQVSSSNQIDLKPKASGQIVYLNAKQGQSVKKGVLLAQLDTTSARQAIKSAQDNLESAQIALEKFKGPDSLSTPRNKQEAQDNLAKAYEDGYNTVASVFLDLPSIMSGLNDILYKYSFSNTQQNLDYYASSISVYSNMSESYRRSADDSYLKARTSYDANFADYKASSRFSENAVIESLILKTYDDVKNIAQAIKDANNLIQFYNDKMIEHSLQPSSTSTTHLSSLSTYLSKTNSALTNLYSAKDTIKTDKQNLDDADLDLRSEELSLSQKETALANAKTALADYFIYAPFDGIIAKVNLEKGDDASSGTSVITFIADKKIAEISLSEIDVAKIKTGNKAIVSFDAVEDLSISGEVSEVDTLGTTSQGVVSYGVKIAFDTQDERVKPGMSASVIIITDTKQDALIVPSSAVKSVNGAYYVQVLGQKYDLASQEATTKGVVSKAAPTRKTVEIGLADDTNTEIKSGLSEGDQVVSRTSSSSLTSGSSSKNSTNNFFRTTTGGGAPPR